MNTQTEVKPNQKPATETPEQRRLVGLVLVAASRFNNSETITANPSVVGGGSPIAITPARLLASGDWRTCVGEESPTGFGVAQYRGTGKDKKLYRAWFPIHSVAEVLYGE